MNWIYLSPHLDDVALSCGGLVWEQTQVGKDVQIWTICAGDPPDGPLSPFAHTLHERWQTRRDAIAIRREEDLHSCTHLAARARHFLIPDCIYRQVHSDEPGEGPVFLYASEEALFGPIHPAEESLVQALALELEQALPSQTEIVCPLALGGHADHRLVRSAAERLGRDLYYYPDYPYLLKTSAEIDQLLLTGWRQSGHPISTAGLAAWQNAVAAHKSQMSTFWPNEKAMKSALKSDLANMGGLFLWNKPFS